MHLEGQHPFFPYSEEEKLEIRKEIGMKESILQEDIDALSDWFYKQPHLTHASLDPDHIEKLLIATKGSREKTKQRIDNFCKHRSLVTELLNSRSKVLSDPEYDPWTFYRQTALLKLYKGKRISVFQITDPDPSNFDINVVLTNTLMLADLRLKFDYMLGDIWIMDLENSSLGHLLRVNPVLVQKFSNILQDGMGFKLFEMHIINAPSFGNQVINFLKQFAKPKILGRCYCHDKFEDLHQYIPKTYLPKDYGGDQPSLDDFKDMYRKEIIKDLSKEYLMDTCRLISDESKRVGTKFQDEYLVGSFKKLDLD